MSEEKKALFIASLLVLGVFAVLSIEKPGHAQTSKDSTRTQTIDGRVTSTYGPVENARIRVAGAEESALTDRQGRFTLQSSHPQGARLRVTAGKEGWFNNEQTAYVPGPTNDIFLSPVYLDDRADYRFISPVTCSGCHNKLTRYWDQSKMAHTTSNPKVLDMYYGTDALKRKNAAPGYRIDNPKSNGNCALCHAPSAAVSIPKVQDLQTALRSEQTEWDGISCDYCHKVRKIITDRGKPSGKAAILERQTSSRGASILVFGPYDDVVVPPMAASYNPVFDQGLFCSVCHSHSIKLSKDSAWDRNKIYTDSEWNGFELKDNTDLPIQSTYQEWKQWQDTLPRDDANKGKKCQDCHMSWRKEMLPYDNYVIDGHARDMWGTQRSPQNIRPHHFDGGTETQLKTALSMELEGKISGNKLTVTVYITNTNGGHWVPTGETMRSVMLVLKADDSNGKPLEMVKGNRLPAWAGEGKVEAGNYAGLPGAVFARVLQDGAGNLNVPFWRATAIASDTRIRPRKTVILEYEFVMSDPGDEPIAEARLIYRPVIRSLAEGKRWITEDIIITSSAW